MGLPVPGLQKQSACVIQVKSFEGNREWDTKAVDDIGRAFDHYLDVEMGLIVSTATSRHRTLESALKQAPEETGKSVSLLIGADVAAFVAFWRPISGLINATPNKTQGRIPSNLLNGIFPCLIGR